MFFIFVSKSLAKKKNSLKYSNILQALPLLGKE